MSMKKHLQRLAILVLSVLFLLLKIETVSAQILYPIGGDQYSSATSKLFNEAYNPSMDSADVPVILTKISRSRSVDTTPLMKAFPHHRIPSLTIPVALPDLSGYIDTLAILWYLRNPMRPSIGVVNVMLIAQTPNHEFVYFVDSNNNGSFLDDHEPFQFRAGEKERQVQIRDIRLEEVTLLLRNLAPDVSPTIYKNQSPAAMPATANQEEPMQIIDKENQSAKRFGIHFIGGLSSGSGDASMYFRVLDKPDSDETNKAYHYTAKYFASLNTQLGIAFSYRNFYLGGSGSYELSQVGEQNLTTRLDKSGTPTSRFQNNQGNWPYTRFNMTFFAEYDIPLSSKLKLAPIVSYTSFNILTEQPFRIFGEAKLNDYFRDRYTYSYGGKLKYVVSDKAMLFAELHRRENHFDASSYFPDIVDGSFKMKLNQIYGGVGVQVRVFGL